MKSSRFWNRFTVRNFENLFPTLFSLCTKCGDKAVRWTNPTGREMRSRKPLLGPQEMETMMRCGRPRLKSMPSRDLLNVLGRKR